MGGVGREKEAARRRGGGGHTGIGRPKRFGARATATEKKKNIGGRRRPLVAVRSPKSRAPTSVGRSLPSVQAGARRCGHGVEPAGRSDWQARSYSGPSGVTWAGPPNRSPPDLPAPILAGGKGSDGQKHPGVDGISFTVHPRAPGRWLVYRPAPAWPLIWWRGRIKHQSVCVACSNFCTARGKTRNENYGMHGYCH